MTESIVGNGALKASAPRARLSTLRFMWPIERAPEAFQRFGRFTFNYWAHGGFKKLVFDDVGLAGITTELAVIAAMSAVFFMVAVVLLSRQRS